MALLLRQAPAAAGLRWVGMGFRTLMHAPLGFAGLFVMALLAMLVLSLVPVLGGLVMLGLMPLLGLAYMVSTRAALQGLPVHPGHLAEPWRGPPSQRRALLVLCALYAAATVVVMLLGEAVDGGTFVQLQHAMAKGEAAKAEVNSLLEDPRLAQGVVLRTALIAALSVPFWHAPALVQWGGQGAAQALFSSTLAVWRCKGAFFTYSLGWVAVMAAFAAVAGLVLSALGTGGAVSALVMPAALFFSAAFYCSLWFTFADSFETLKPTP